MLDRITTVVLSAPNIERLIEITNEELRNSAANATKRVALVADRLVGIRQRLERLYDALETGKLYNLTT